MEITSQQKIFTAPSFTCQGVLQGASMDLVGSQWMDGSVVRMDQPDIYKTHLWVFPQIEVSQNGLFLTENPIKMDKLGVPLFSETSTFIYMYFF